MNHNIHSGTSCETGVTHWCPETFFLFNSKFFTTTTTTTYLPTLLQYFTQVLRCLVPEGIGKNLSVAVVVGNQTSMAVTGMERLNRLQQPATASMVVMEPSEQWRYDPPTVSFMYPDVGPTKGGFTLTLKGRNFGTRDWGAGTALGKFGKIVFFSNLSFENLSNFNYFLIF